VIKIPKPDKAKPFERSLSKYLKQHVEQKLQTTIHQRTWARYVERLKEHGAFSLNGVEHILNVAAPGTTFLEAIERWVQSGSDVPQQQKQLLPEKSIALLKAKFRSEGIPPSTYYTWFLKAGVITYQVELTDKQQQILLGIYQVYKTKKDLASLALMPA